MQKNVPTKSGSFKLSWIRYKAGNIYDPATDPNLPILTIIPNANDNSFPKNHLLTTADYVTVKFSPPNPKIILPINIITNVFLDNVDKKHTNYPIITIKENKNNPYLTPILSIKIPPNRGKIIFGIE